MNFANNIGYDNVWPNSLLQGNIVQDETNSWNDPPNITVSDADFLSVDSTGVTGPRQADGSLPDLDFLKLKSTSGLIGTGTDVGLTVDAEGKLWSSPPSLGAYEYLSGQLVESIVVTGAGDATTIETDGGTLQMSAAILPVDADVQTVIWSIADGTGHGTISYTGLVTAWTDGTVTVTATATDGSGIDDDLELTFSNQDIYTPAVLTSDEPTAIHSVTITTGGEVTDDGGATVTARGVCWNTSTNPTTSNSFTVDGTGEGVFTSTMAGLSGNTLYYVRAYATNSEGTAYGLNVQMQTTKDSFVKRAGKFIKNAGKRVIIR